MIGSNLKPLRRNPKIEDTDGASDMVALLACYRTTSLGGEKPLLKPLHQFTVIVIAITILEFPVINEQ